MQQERSLFVRPQARSKSGNGALLEAIDGRTTAGRRLRDRVAILTEQVEQAHQAKISPAHALLVRRAALLSLYCEGAEAKMAGGEEIDINAVTAATNALRRILIETGALVRD